VFAAARLSPSGVRLCIRFEFVISARRPAPKLKKLRGDPSAPALALRHEGWPFACDAEEKMKISSLGVRAFGFCTSVVTFAGCSVAGTVLSKSSGK
jgi:hypothetical protein